ncbi:YtxH domain-containing protein [Leucobacter sp. gxy201]|uniref:YtxH domain-containing protein n=1 Tax=Leucobacter sp. gxy201 TaxID=2957200 RepID=UPI003DA000C7
MKGKVAFVLGAAVGYVLGTRAGRERYEQIKRGAKAVWGTPPVQRGVAAVRGAAQTRIDQVKGAALQAGKNLIGGGRTGNGATGGDGAASGAGPANPGGGL